MHPKFDHKQIARYLERKMAPVEVDFFEAQLRDNKVLLAETKAYARIHELDVEGFELLKPQAAPAQPTAQPKSEKAMPAWAWLLIALAVSALVYFFAT